MQIRILSILLLFISSFNFLQAQECGFIYVSPAGATSGTAGTKSNPADLLYGISLATGSVKHLRIAQGSYAISNEINLTDGIILEGGFDGTIWNKSNMYITSINRDNSNALTSPSRLVAFNCVNISGFRVQDITVNVDDAGGSGTSIYAFYLSGCSDFILSRCIINTGKGSDGLPGQPGTPGVNGGNGSAGETGEGEGACCYFGGQGAGVSSPAYTGASPGGNGGDGGQRGGFVRDTQIVNFPPAPLETLYYVYPGSDYGNPGSGGQPGTGNAAGQGGAGGATSCQTTFVNGNCAATSSNRGRAGGDGYPGLPGLQGVQGLAAFTGGFYVPGDGSVGDPGQSHGGAGGGGGGGGGKGCEPAALHPLTGDTVYFTSGTGGGGGGGGEGGQLGQGGLGGTGGGASFCVFINNNGANGIVQDCVFNPGLGGQGGAGGAGGPGGAGGLGGLGGVIGDNGPTHSCNNGEGGSGGNGGAGGTGGVGGKGSDGFSRGLYEVPGGEQVLRPFNYNPFAPQVTIEYFGCTNSTIVATTNATGNINWLFGYAATPQTASGNTVTAEYGSPLGYRNVTLVVDGVPYFFANFINLETSFTKPTILASSKTICAGQSTDLSTTTSGAASYSWNIQGSSLPFSPSQFPGTVTYNLPGVYPVTLQTTTCCGVSTTVDTIRVLSAVRPSLGRDTAVCYLEPLPALRAIGYAGAAYTWTVNGNPWGSDTSVVQAGGPGEYICKINYGNGCVGQDTIQFDVYTTLPLFLEDTTICLNSPFPLLDANYYGGTMYAWTLNGNPIGLNDKYLQSTIPGTYNVTVTAPSGCAGTDSIRLAISDPRVNLGFDVIICENEGLPVLNAQNIGSDYEWKYNNGLTGGNTQTLATSLPGLYGVTITDQYGCQASDQMILTLTPSITADFNGPTTVSANVPSSFIDATVPGAIQWTWDFGDNTPHITTSTANHSYSQAGTYPVFLIAGNGVCSDTATGTVTVQWNCATLGLTANISAEADTIALSELGTILLEASGDSALSFSWDFGDSNTSTEDTLVYAYSEAGTYIITLTAYNHNCTTSVTQTIVVIDKFIGIDETTFGSDKVLTFPNPFKNELNVLFSQKPENAVNIELVNTLAQQVFYQDNETESKLSFTLPQLPAGVYFLNIRSGNNVARFKVVRE